MLPEELLDLIRHFEGLRLKAYLCPAGVPTIGYGSTGPDIRLGMVWTLDQAEARMRKDAIRFVNSTMALCPNLDGNRLSAITDFAYNLGTSRLKTSTLRKRVLSEDWDSAADELRKWVWGGGRKLPGLILRREAEASLLLQGNK